MKNILVLILILQAWLVGCATKLQNLKEPQVELKNVKVKELGMSDVKLLFNFSVQNPNPVEVAVDEIEYNLKLNGKDFTKGTLSENLKVGPESSVVIPLPVSFKYQDLFGNLSELLKSRKLDYEVDGSINLGLLSIPYKKSGLVELKD